MFDYYLNLYVIKLCKVLFLSLLFFVFNHTSKSTLQFFEVHKYFMRLKEKHVHTASRVTDPTQVEKLMITENFS